jgi:hypothetical protein
LRKAASHSAAADRHSACRLLTFLLISSLAATAAWQSVAFTLRVKKSHQAALDGYTRAGLCNTMRRF